MSFEAASRLETGKSDAQKYSPNVGKYTPELLSLSSAKLNQRITFSPQENSEVIIVSYSSDVTAPSPRNRLVTSAISGIQALEKIYAC